jgi:hypothetical protein
MSLVVTIINWNLNLKCFLFITVGGANPLSSAQYYEVYKTGMGI